MRIGNTATKLKAPHFTNVDVMRGVAVTLVIWIHVSATWVNTPHTPDFLYRLADGLGFGQIGVMLFFCISGFVIPSSLHGYCAEGLRRFAMRRFFRLYPAYWLSIPGGLVVYYYLPGRPFEPAMVLANFTMVPGWLHHEMIMGVYWTLHIELFFYLLCAGLFAVKLLKNEFCLVWTGWLLHAVFLAGLANHYFSQYTGLYLVNDFPLQVMRYASSLGIMFWAALLRLSLEVEISKRGRIWLWLVPVLWAVVLPLTGVFARYVLHSPSAGNIQFSLTAGAAIVLFVGGLKLPAMANRFALFLGAISYSLYLFHPIVSVLIVNALSFYFVNFVPSLGMVLLVCYLSAMLLAALTYRFVELPGQRMAKRIAP